MSEKIIRAMLDTTVILGAVGNPSGPNAHVIAGVYTMVLAQSVIAEALRHLRQGFGKVPPLSDRQIRTPVRDAFSTLVEPSPTRASAANDTEHDSCPV